MHVSERNPIHARAPERRPRRISAGDAAALYEKLRPYLGANEGAHWGYLLNVGRDSAALVRGRRQGSGPPMGFQEFLAGAGFLVDSDCEAVSTPQERANAVRAYLDHPIEGIGLEKRSATQEDAILAAAVYVAAKDDERRQRRQNRVDSLSVVWGLCAIAILAALLHLAEGC